MCEIPEFGAITKRKVYKITLNDDQINDVTFY